MLLQTPLLIALAAFAPGEAAEAATPPMPPSPEAAAPAPAPRRLPAGLEVHLVLAEEVASNTHARGDFFWMAVARDLVSDDQVVIPAGTPVVGQVVHAAKAGASGKAGELILAARYIDWEGRQIPLRAFRTGSPAGGGDRSGTALGVGMVVPFANFLVRGRQRVMAEGSVVGARLAEDVVDTGLPSEPPADDAGGAPSGATDHSGEFQ